MPSIHITLDQWVHDAIEARREAKGVNRSECVQELIIKGMHAEETK